MPLECDEAAVLAQAELARTEGSTAAALFEAAAESAEKYGFTQYVALAYELAAAYDDAYRQKALAAYQQWGVHTKLTRLRGA